MTERIAAKSAVVVLETADSFVLERRPNLPGKLAYPSKLQLFGGGREEGEDGATAAARELGEELDLEVEPMALAEHWTGEYLGEDKNGLPILRHVSVYHLGLTALGREFLRLRVQGEVADIAKTAEALNLHADEFTPFTLRILRELVKSKEE